MPEITKDTVITKENSGEPVVASPVVVAATTSQTAEYVVYFFLGALEILLAFRLVLKLMGASTASGFVRFIYGFSGIFVYPFEGIFRKGVTQGIETVSVLEPSTIVAMIVYALVAWGIVKFIRISSGEQQPAE